MNLMLSYSSCCCDKTPGRSNLRRKGCTSAHSSLDRREVTAEELGATDHLAFIAGKQRVVSAHCPSTLFLRVCIRDLSQGTVPPTVGSPSHLGEHHQNIPPGFPDAHLPGDSKVCQVDD